MTNEPQLTDFIFNPHLVGIWGNYGTNIARKDDATLVFHKDYIVFKTPQTEFRSNLSEIRTVDEHLMQINNHLVEHLESFGEGEKAFCTFAQDLWLRRYKVFNDIIGLLEEHGFSCEPINQTARDKQ